MKKFLVLLLSLALISSLTACGTKREPAQVVVEKAMTAVQKYDKDAIVEYFGSNDFYNNATGEISEDSETVAKMIFSSMTYKIVSSVEDEKTGTATVVTDIANIDMTAVMSDFMSGLFEKAMQYAFLPEDQQPSDEEMNALYLDEFTSLLQSGNYDTVTKTVDIELTMSDDTWTINPSTELVDALMGGISSFADEMGGLNENATEDDTSSKIQDIRNWLVSDIWNDGICDMSSYYYDGTSATGQTMDADFTVQQLAKAMELKPGYDAYMASLSGEHAEISSLWEKVSEQVDILYAEIVKRGTVSDGSELDTGLYNQYFDAFDTAIRSIG